MTKTLLLLSSLLFGLSANFLLGAALDPVLDIDGAQLRNGVEYYILPVFRGRGGGLTLGGGCPRDVVQAQNELDNGLPLTFTPVDPKEGIIRESTDLNFVFSASTICVQSTIWRLSNNETTGDYFVSTGGVQGNPGRETISNWFKIEKNQDDYNLRFCPTVCDTCRVICRDIGIAIENGRRRLVLSEEPFKVKFKKA
ncbi:hypothetical protein RJ639_017332 [Escallonia herrerae]|uniref:Uncharacterized protein n=1 Tax=Escallonia herrerae TaxID=1293975 RepID=A0AA89ALF5_9ASTE|nr:hypothetical protein RJ639_017332 [Escallonia herrerae]